MTRIKLTKTLISDYGRDYPAGTEGELVSKEGEVSRLDLEWKSIWINVPPKKSFENEEIRFRSHYTGKAKVGRKVMFHSDGFSSTGEVIKLRKNNYADLEFRGIARGIEVDGDCYNIIGERGIRK